MSNKLFVGNLSYNVTENDLQDLFGQHGTVTEVNLMLDRMSGRSRGFAFVTMSSKEEAEAAATEVVAAAAVVVTGETAGADVETAAIADVASASTKRRGAHFGNFSFR